MKKALLYFFGFVVIQFFLSWIVYAAWLLATGSSADDVLRAFGGGNPAAITAPMLVAASALASAATIAVFVWRRWAVVSPAYMRTRQWGVFAWCAVAALGTLIPSVALQELLPEMPDLSGDTFKLIMDNRYGYFVLCSLLGSMGNHWAAIAVSAVIFAVVHANPAQMPHALLIGLLLGWMYYRTGSILPGIALHWVNNTAAYVFYVLFPFAADMKLTEFFGGNQNNVVLAVVFSLFILIPAIYQLNRLMRRA